MNEQQMARIDEPNTCNLWQWLSAFCLSFLALTLSVYPIRTLLALTPFSLSGPLNSMNAFLVIALSYACAFWVMVLCLKILCHTSFRDFISGRTGRPDLWNLLTMTGLYCAGILLSLFLCHEKIQSNHAPFGMILINGAICVLLVWMQSALEECLFRGIVIRYVGKGECTFTVKQILAGLLSSLLFMCLHLSNPEVSGQARQIDQIFALLSYFSAGMIFYLLDLAFGDLTPGLTIHLVNNLIAFTILSSPDEAGRCNTLLTTLPYSSGIHMLTGTLLNFLPLILYVIILACLKKLPCQQSKDQDLSKSQNS